MMANKTAQALVKLFEGAADFETREILCGGVRAAVYYIDGLTSGGDIAEFILQPLSKLAPATEAEIFARASAGAVWCASMQTADTAEAAARLLVNGHCAVYFGAQEKALCFEVKTGEKRGPSSPEAENTIKGAKDAFVETVRTNTSLVRRHLRTPQLRLRQLIVGKRTLTNVTVCYIEGLTDQALVARMTTRIKAIDIDGLLLPAAVEEYITGSRKTAFPLLQYTERTDKFCQGLLDGQVGLLVDGLPLGYLAPVSLGRLMQSPEDRAVDYVSASFVRVLRYLALFASLLLPAVYAATAMFHQQMLPTKLLLAIIESKKDVPFDTIFEVLGLLAAFELLQQAGLHLPQAIGTAVSIIGGLVVGTAAVEAKLVSPAALIVTASAGICGFALPNRDVSDAVRVWRFALAALAGLWGLFGVTVGFLALVVHLASLTSLDVSYLAPFSRASSGGAILRGRLKNDIFRDASLRPQDARRQR